MLRWFTQPDIPRLPIVLLSTFHKGKTVKKKQALNCFNRGLPLTSVASIASAPRRIGASALFRFSFRFCVPTEEGPPKITAVGRLELYSHPVSRTARHRMATPSVQISLGLAHPVVYMRIVYATCLLFAVDTLGTAMLKASPAPSFGGVRFITGPRFGRLGSIGKGEIAVLTPSYIEKPFMGGQSVQWCDRVAYKASGFLDAVIKTSCRVRRQARTQGPHTARNTSANLLPAAFCARAGVILSGRR